MKKLSILAATVLLAMSITACGKSDDKQNNNPSTTQDTNVVTMDESQTEAETEEETLAPMDYTAGTWDGDVYTNESIGVTFTLPNGWTAGTALELAQVQNAGSEITGTSEEELAALMEQATYDLYIYNTETSSQIMMMGEDFSAYNGITAEDYLDSVGSQLTNLDPSTGMEYEVSEYYDLQIGDSTFTAMDARLTYNGITTTQTYATYEINGKIVSMILTDGPDAANECMNVVSTMTSIK